MDPEGGIRLTGREGDYGFGSILMNDAAPGQNREITDPLYGKKATIGIIGLGYVGLPLSLRFTDKGFKTLGFDKVAILKVFFC